jgi:MFS family permease
MSHVAETQSIRKVIGASSVGPLLEWYGFYIFGSLATVIANQFFPKTNPTAALLSTLATFAAGFIVRPFGALVFGRLGDLIGRKYTFLLTLILMGGSTFAIGLVPGYDTIDLPHRFWYCCYAYYRDLPWEVNMAPLLMLLNTLLQTGEVIILWIQTTATLGLFISLGVILITRHSLIQTRTFHRKI